MDSQATGLGKTENDTAVATLGPAVCGHATAGALRENVPDIVWLPYDDSGNMTNDGHYSYTYDPENRLTQVQKPNPLALDMLAQAVDSELAFTTGGLGLWQRQTGSPSYHDGDCAQSGGISDNNESWMQTTVEGAGTLTFWWKVSSESGCDFLEFYLDNQLQSGHISGEVDWTQKSYTITGAGTHTLKWRYVKDGSSSFGDDCGWVDWVQWTGTLPPAPAEPLWFYLDGVESYGCRTGNWEQKSYTITGSGTHTLRWLFGRYTQDWSGVGYVDDVQWTGYIPQPPAPPAEPLRFYLDGVESYGCRTGSWEQKSYTITGSGPHTLQWLAGRYTQDWSGTGYVDKVQWTGSMPPAADAWGTVNYLYDASGRRIEKRIDGRTITKYVYDGDHCLAEYDGSGNLRRKYIYGPGVDQPICMIEATQSYAGTYYYHFDALGSVVVLTSGNAGSMGNTVEVYEYDVYGRVGASDPNHPNRFLFTGREYDKETGLYYYRARYYNPQIGRFLQTDPIGYGDGMNWYSYCGNSPCARTDPSGCYDELLGPSPENDYTFDFECPATALAPPGMITSSEDALTAATNFFTDQWSQWDTSWLVSYVILDGQGTVHIRFYHPCWTPADTAQNPELWPAPATPDLTWQYVNPSPSNPELTCMEPVILLNGIGLLQMWKFDLIMQPSRDRVESWLVRDGSHVTYTPEEKALLNNHCDTPFFSTPIQTWEIGKTTYDRSQINYYLEGWAMNHLHYRYAFAYSLVLAYKNKIAIEKGLPLRKPGDLAAEYYWFNVGWVEHHIYAP